MENTVFFATSWSRCDTNFSLVHSCSRASCGSGVLIFLLEEVRLVADRVKREWDVQIRVQPPDCRALRPGGRTKFSMLE